MTWSKLPDEYLIDPRILSLTDRAFRLFVNGLLYSNRILSDGYLPEGVVSMLAPGGSPKVLKAAVKELREARLWDWKPPDGFYIADFTKHQLTKAQLEERSEQKKLAAQERWRLDGLRREAMREAGARASALQTYSESNGHADASAMPVPRTPSPVAPSSQKDGRSKSTKSRRNRTPEREAEQAARIARVTNA